MKIKVKDYYAIKRAEARAKALDQKKRQEIAKKASQKRWANLKPDYIETNNEEIH